MRLRHCLVLLALCLSACTPERQADQRLAAPPPSLRETITYLASDELEGRGVDTAGIDKAADYIADRFQRAGLKPPPGQAGYFQPFEFVTADAIDRKTTLSSGQTKYSLSQDFTAAAFSAEGSFSGPVVFAGYGIVNPERGYDDYAGIDVKDKVVLLLRYEPHTAQGKSRFADHGWSSHASLEAKVRAAHERGAKAILLVNPPTHHGTDLLLPFARMFTAPDRKVPFLHVRREVANDLVQRGGAGSLAELQKQIDDSGAPASRELGDVAVSGHVQLQRTSRTLKNVVAWLPGEKRDEYVIIGAHYDHIGRGGPGSLAPGTNEIHNGADDNASGVAGMLAVADRLAAGPRPARSVLFVAFTAEEIGLIGSNHFVRHPPVPLRRMVAMLNLDMIGRVRDDDLMIGGMGTARPFDAIIAELDAASPLEVKDFGRGGLGPSDHMVFAIKKVPVLFLFSGVHSDYHRPSDDADRINYERLEQVVDFAEGLATALTRMPRSEYIAFSDRPTTGPSPGGSRVLLGVVPDYASGESTSGVAITGTTPGSPAEKAGLQSGDVITRFGDKPIENVYDLTGALADADPGQKIVLSVRRGQQQLEVPVELVGR
jgi:hypothetical protein